MRQLFAVCSPPRPLTHHLRNRAVPIHVVRDGVGNHHLNLSLAIRPSRLFRLHARARSCHPADETLYRVLMFHRHAHAASATPIGASEPLFEFIKAQLAILWLIGMNQAGRGQPAPFAGRFKNCVRWQVGQMKVRLPAHAKSSMRGMRV